MDLASCSFSPVSANVSGMPQDVLVRRDVPDRAPARRPAAVSAETAVLSIRKSGSGRYSLNRTSTPLPRRGLTTVTSFLLRLRALHDRLEPVVPEQAGAHPGSDLVAEQQLRHVLQGLPGKCCICPAAAARLRRAPAPPGARISLADAESVVKARPRGPDPVEVLLDVPPQRPHLAQLACHAEHVAFRQLS